MKIDNFLKTNSFFLTTSTLAISSFASMLLIVSESSRKCSEVAQNSLCSLLHLCESTNRYVCEQKSHENTIIETAVEGVFLVSIGLMIGRSSAILFDRYVLTAMNRANRE